MRRRLAVMLATALLGVAALAAAPAAASPRGAATDATYFNNAALPAADVYVLHDPRSGYYYAYSTTGAYPGYYFAIYKSADLVTWERAAPGALPVNDPKQWGNTWFWAPETYYNPRTGLYYMVYAARSDANAKRWFGYSDYAEPCKIGVAVSRSPAGPFHNIANHPIDYNPYDPTYHDVNLIMPNQLKPPATLQEGEKAPLGTYVPEIDPDLLFAPDGRIYMYFSRNAYRHWVWDPQLHKYLEQSEIDAVQLTDGWWNDPTGRTMPTVAPAFRGTNNVAGGPPGPRRDGYVRVLDYNHDPQAWENADVNDYALSHGTLKDRRWEEGAEVLATHFGGRSRYYLLYSANNSSTEHYAEGYAVAEDPLGPFHKSPRNPILATDPAIHEYGPGHGGIALSPDGKQYYFVHLGRPQLDAERHLYTDRMVFSPSALDPWGNPLLSIDESTSDQPVPSGVAPYSVLAAPAAVTLTSGTSTQLSWHVLAATGAELALGNPLNRVRVTVGDPSVVTAALAPGGSTATLTAHGAGRTTLTLTYQRLSSNGVYHDVHQGQPMATVQLEVPVIVNG